MKRHLILSTCLVSLTAAPLLASNNNAEERMREEQRRLLSKYESEKEVADTAILEALLSNPQLATPEELSKLSLDLQIEYATKLSEREAQQRHETQTVQEITTISSSGRTKNAHEQIEEQNLRKIEELLALGENAPMTEIYNLPDNYRRKYVQRKEIIELERRRRLEEASSASSASSSASSSSSSSSISTPEPSQNNEIDAYKRIQQQNFDRKVQELLKLKGTALNDALGKVSEQILEMYFQALEGKSAVEILPSSSSASTTEPAAVTVTTTPTTTAATNNPTNTTASATPSVAQEEVQTDAEIRREQDKAYEKSLQNDEMKEQLPKKIERLDKDLRSEREKWGKLNQEAQKLSVEKLQKNYAKTAAKNDAKVFASLTQGIEDLQKKLDSITNQMNALKSSIEQKTTALEVARNKLAELTKKKK